jgi:predicted DNA-binding transcriptional regulator YafY
VILTEGELFSIALFDQLLEQYRNTPLESDLRAIFKKIVSSLPDNVTVDAGFISSSTSFIPEHAPKIDTKVFQKVFTALKTRHTLTFGYTHLDVTDYAIRTVDPYHAICHRATWYLLGYCHNRKMPRMYSFARISNPKITKQTFIVPSDFNPGIYFDKQMGVHASEQTPYTFELLVDKAISTYALQRIWHSTQDVKQNDDGSVYIKFTTTQLDEVFRWTLAQGSQVKVLNPPRLVTKIKTEIEKMGKMYV